MVLCCVPLCDNRSETSDFSFYRLPKEPDRRAKYLALIRRKDFLPSSETRICSWHFPNGKSELPSRFLWNEGKRFEFPEVPVAKTKRARKEIAPEDSASSSANACGSLGFPHSSSIVLEVENQMLREQVKRLEAAANYKGQRLTFNQISHSNELVSYYTSLPSAEVFKTLVTYVSMLEFQYYGFKVTSLCLEDQILLTLMKLRHAFGHTDLGVRFGVSRTTVGNIFRTFVCVFSEALFEPVLDGKMPCREKNATELPESFRSFPNCRTVLDCTEVRIEIPDAIGQKNSTYSAYKSYNTFKVMVGAAPNGIINFVSPVYGGNASDKHIVKDCGIIDQLETGDMILADKGFPIKDIVPDGIQVNTPSYLYNGQFTKHEVLHNREVAKARIHVERAIARLKVYNILNMVPHTYRDIIDSVVRACAILTAMQPRIIAGHRLKNMADKPLT